ncbi:MAG: hypothetical protein J6X77_04955 [Bacteroidales bacterium]|nr:hypothetical protein [Bacteroidales bacterium]MBP5488896.1 hypothetical protein [Bacteroidales bacterium]
MNNVFSPKRFGKYFCYDLFNVKNNFGLTLLILGLLPFILFVVFQLINILFHGTFYVNSDGFMPARVITGIVCVTVAILAFPTKVYGSVTDRRAGSSFLMLPASTFEKWLSMVLMGCVLVPLCLSILYVGSDTVMGLVFPKAYGTPIINMPFDDIIGETDMPIDIHFSFTGLVWGNWSASMLFFTLGAICFKKGKVGKSILVLFVLTILASLIVVAIVGNFDADFANDTLLLNAVDADPETAARKIIALGKALLYFQLVLFLGLNYWRLRTIKH